VKRYWQVAYRGRGRLWADPYEVVKGRYIRYGPEYLEGARLKNEALFDRSKVLVGRSVNINANEPLVARLDTTGFCPANDVFCICTIESIDRTSEPSEAPIGWAELDDYHKLLWLVGILNSEIAFELSLQSRDPRHITKRLITDFHLPARVDSRIVAVANEMVERDKRRLPIPSPDILRQQLNSIVEESYGNPVRLTLVRTGVLPDLDLWEREQSHRTNTVIGQVLDVSPANGILLHLTGLFDDEEECWLPYPPELPGWALDGTVFEADLSQDTTTFSDLAARPWALR